MEKKHIEHYNPEILKELVERYPMAGDAMKIGDYLDGRGPYTYDQVGVLSKCFNVPFGYFFLDKLPPEVKPTNREFEDGYYWVKRKGFNSIEVSECYSGKFFFFGYPDYCKPGELEWVAESQIEKPNLKGASPLKMPEDTKPAKKYLVKEVRSYQDGYLNTFGYDLTNKAVDTPGTLICDHIKELSGIHTYQLMTLIRSFSDKETVVKNYADNSGHKLLQETYTNK